MSLKIHKKNKFSFYINAYVNTLLATKNASIEINALSRRLTNEELEQVQQRVNYYNQLQKNDTLINGTSIKDLKQAKTPKAYYFDAYESARYFDANLAIDYLFGDVITVPKNPSIVKSRPIGTTNENSVLLNLDKARHFIFVENDKAFFEKKPQMIGRFAVYQ